MLFFRRRSTNLNFLLKLPQLMLLHCTAATTTYRRHILRQLDDVHHVQRGSSCVVSDINLQRVQSRQVRSLFFLFAEANKHVIFFWFKKKYSLPIQCWRLAPRRKLLAADKLGKAIAWHWGTLKTFLSDSLQFIPNFGLSLHFIPSLQSAVCILYLVCILYPICSLQSAVCSLHFVLTESAICSLQSAFCTDLL